MPVGLPLPFILVRLLYTLIACFAHHATNFNLVTGSVLVIDGGYTVY